MELEKTNQMNTLFEFYGSLLTEKQQKYMKLYYAEDFSLGEIADAFDVSRQAIYDNIKRTSVILEEYEEKLHIVKEFVHNRRVTEALKEYVQTTYPEDNEIVALIQEYSWGNEAVKGAEHGI